MMETVPENERSSETLDVGRELVERASAGCSDSFGQLVRQNHKLIRLYLGKYVQCSSQVDDIAQEVFFVAFKQLRHFRNEAKFSTWLTGIARNKALEFLKAEIRTRKKQKRFFEAEIASQQISRIENEHRDRELAEERLSVMQMCLDQLPDQLQRLINRYYFDKQTAIDIATESNVSIGSVRMRLLRIRGILRKCIVARSQGRGGNLPVIEFENES